MGPTPMGTITETLKFMVKAKKEKHKTEDHWGRFLVRMSLLKFSIKLIFTYHA